MSNHKLLARVEDLTNMSQLIQGTLSDESAQLRINHDALREEHDDHKIDFETHKTEVEDKIDENEGRIDLHDISIGDNLTNITNHESRIMGMESPNFMSMHSPSAEIMSVQETVALSHDIPASPAFIHVNCIGDVWGNILVTNVGGNNYIQISRGYMYHVNVTINVLAVTTKVNGFMTFVTVPSETEVAVFPFATNPTPTNGNEAMLHHNGFFKSTHLNTLYMGFKLNASIALNSKDVHLMVQVRRLPYPYSTN